MGVVSGANCLLQTHRLCDVLHIRSCRVKLWSLIDKRLQIITTKVKQEMI